MKKLRLAAICAVLACAALMVPVASVYGKQAPSSSVYCIVALGDSIAAGYQPGMTEGSIPYGYTERLYEQALFYGRAKLDNYGVIGLRAAGLNRLLPGAAEGKALKAGILNHYTEETESALRRVGALAPNARILVSDQYLQLPEAGLPPRRRPDFGGRGGQKAANGKPSGREAAGRHVCGAAGQHFALIRIAIPFPRLCKRGSPPGLGTAPSVISHTRESSPFCPRISP